MRRIATKRIHSLIMSNHLGTYTGVNIHQRNERRVSKGNIAVELESELHKFSTNHNAVGTNDANKQNTSLP